MLPIRIYLGVGQSMGLDVSIMTRLYQCSILYNSVAALKVLSVSVCILAPPQPLKATDLTVVSVCVFPRISTNWNGTVCECFRWTYSI